MRNIFKYKTLIIISLFILLLFTFSVSSFSGSSIVYEGQSYTLSDYLSSFKNITIFKKVDKQGKFYSYVYCASNSDYNIIAGDFGFTVSSGLSTDYIFFNDVFYDNLEGLLSSGEEYSRRVNTFHNSEYMVNISSNIIYSNCDVKDSEGNVVFQGAPQVPEITKTLVEQTTQAQITQQLQTMIVGFLKYLIVFVILVISFWKGLKFLLRQLQEA